MFINNGDVLREAFGVWDKSGARQTDRNQPGKGNPCRGEKVLGAVAELKTLPGTGPPLWHVRGEQGKWHPEARLGRASCVAKEFGLYAEGCRKGHIYTVGE